MERKERKMHTALLGILGVIGGLLLGALVDEAMGIGRMIELLTEMDATGEPASTLALDVELTLGAPATLTATALLDVVTTLTPPLPVCCVPEPLPGEPAPAEVELVVAERVLDFEVVVGDESVPSSSSLIYRSRII